MIISTKHKYVFISTPKTGTHTMFNLLINQFDGQRVVTNGFHSTKIPNEINIDEYTIFTTVRNPYDRFVALWYSILYVREDYIQSWSQYLSDKSLESFAIFINNQDFIQNKSKVRLAQLVIPQYKWVSFMPKKTIILHLENLNQEFHELSFVNKKCSIPHNLKREHESWDRLKNSKVTDLINKWAEYDFQLFGYQQELVE